MLAPMRTTLVLNDDLLARAKAMALQQGTTMSEITNRALRDYLRKNPEGSADQPKPRIHLPSYRGPGPVNDMTPGRIAELRDLEGG